MSIDPDDDPAPIRVLIVDDQPLIRMAPRQCR